MGPWPAHSLTDNPNHSSLTHSECAPPQPPPPFPLPLLALVVPSLPPSYLPVTWMHMPQLPMLYWAWFMATVTDTPDTSGATPLYEGASSEHAPPPLTSQAGTGRRRRSQNGRCPSPQPKHPSGPALLTDL